MINLNKLVLLTSMLIAIMAASFSVYGIGLLFSGAAIAAMVMASALELGKLVTTSWLFRNWNIANKLMKIYMLFAVIVLMGITSLGIFGYLTSAYQKSALENELRLTKIKTFETQRTDENENINVFQNEVEKLYQLRKDQESRMTETLNNPLITRNPIQLQTIQGQINSQIDDINTQIKSTNNKVETSKSNISKLDEDIINLKIEGSEQKDIVTFKFVAEEFNTDMNGIAKWFIFIIIAVFDPLAVVLLIAANMSINSMEDDSNIKKKVLKNNILNEKPVEVIKEVEKPVEVIKEVEKPVEVIKEIEKPVEVIKEIEKPVEVIKNKKDGTSGLFSF